MRKRSQVGCGRRDFGARMENGKVVPFRHVHDDGFCGSLLGKVGGELLPQESRMRSHNTVFAGVIAWMATEHPNANLLLSGIFGSLPNCTFGYVKQELAKAGG